MIMKIHSDLLKIFDQQELNKKVEASKHAVEVETIGQDNFLQNMIFSDKKLLMRRGTN